MAVGVLAATGELPMSLKVFEDVISKKFPADKIAVNLEAYQIGKNLMGVKK